MKAPLPRNEGERLRTLGLYQVLDTASEKSFDDLVRLASQIAGTPISVMSLVDDARQWFKAKVGLDATETSRDVAFCAHAILGEEVFIVEDATKDDRFSDNPLVTSDPSIRFYAGAPLIMPNGEAIGTLCVIDSTPRKLEESQVDALRVLRDAVVTQLELRRAISDLKAVAQLLPLCAWCRNVRSEQGRWCSLEEYVGQSGVSHGICPDCQRQFDHD